MGILESLDNFKIFWEMLDFFWKITNYNFQSKRQIMTARAVY